MDARYRTISINRIRVRLIDTATMASPASATDAPTCATKKFPFSRPAEVFGGDLTGLHSLHGCCHNRFASGVYHARHGLEPLEFDAKR
jgi:hypothetical protein